MLYSYLGDKLMKNKKLLLKWFLLIIWLIIIFLLSSDAGSSSNTSSVLDKLFFFVKSKHTLNILNFTIRKLAHLTEYFILALLLIFLLKEYSLKERYLLLISSIFCFIYALFDEFHQSFITSRTSSFKDVLIDTTGGLLALITYLTYNHRKKTKKSI